MSQTALLPDSIRRDPVRTASGHAVGACNGCGTGIAYTEAVTVVCHGCGASVRLHWVSGLMSGDVCDTLCMYARGPDCECNCGGANHGIGYLSTRVPTWSPDGVVLAAPEIPARIRERDARREETKRERAEAKAAAKRAETARAVAELTEANPDLSELLGARYADTSSRFMGDMRDALRAGYMSPRQIAAAVKAVREDRERDARRTAAAAARADAAAAAEARGVSIPSGRVTFAGTITGVKEVPSDYSYSGTVWKCTVTAADGWRVYGSVPKGLEPLPIHGGPGEVLSAEERDARADAWLNWTQKLVGRPVSITATIEPSGDDALFGFFKRPRLTQHQPEQPAAAPAVDQDAEQPAAAPRPRRCAFHGPDTICPDCGPVEAATLRTVHAERAAAEASWAEREQPATAADPWADLF